MAASCAPHRRLFRKYVLLFVALVSAALVGSGLLQAYFSYQESAASVGQIQREKAATAATKIGQFIDETQREIVDVIPPPWLADTVDLAQREIDYRLLLRRAPAITEVRYLDGSGREQLLVSRLTMNVVRSGTDYSMDPGFLRARADHDYFSDVYFRSGSEPYVTFSRAEGGADACVTTAEVNLKFIGDVISQIRIGRSGYAYLVDPSGRLIAHPDLELVLQLTDLSTLPQVSAAIAARSAGVETDSGLSGNNLEGQTVVAAYDVIDPPGWSVIVEQSQAEVFGPLYASLERTAVLLIGGLIVAVLAGLYVTRRMVAPIQALRVGAARIGSGALDHRIDVRTHDELEVVADEFNRMSARLQESYASLEARIQERTRALAATLEELAQRTHELEVVSQHKSEFLAHMSHELRTPLHAIIGFSEMLLEHTHGEVNERQARSLNHVLTAGRHLLELINDVLDLSKVEAGRMELEREQFVLSDVIEGCLTVMRESATRRKISLRVDLDPAIGVIDGDERRVKQVVFNLLSNALKFTPEGGHILVSARLIDGEVQVAIRDNGTGIPREDWTRIFEPFQQSRQRPGTINGGTGLGLALSRQFIELHGGRLWVESDVGSGSTFSFSLPAPTRATVDGAEAVAVSSSG
jgi:signal transduction histidine kinase